MRGLEQRKAFSDPHPSAAEPVLSGSLGQNDGAAWAGLPRLEGGWSRRQSHQVGWLNHRRSQRSAHTLRGDTLRCVSVALQCEGG